jgi:hypothetical protein
LSRASHLPGPRDAWKAAGALVSSYNVGLDRVVQWLKTSAGVSEFLLGLLTWRKYTFAVIDALLYVVFLVNMAWLFLNELRWRKADHDEG